MHVLRNLASIHLWPMLCWHGVSLAGQCRCTHCGEGPDGGGVCSVHCSLLSRLCSNSSQVGAAEPVRNGHRLTTLPPAHLFAPIVSVEGHPCAVSVSEVPARPTRRMLGPQDRLQRYICMFAATCVVMWLDKDVHSPAIETSATVTLGDAWLLGPSGTGTAIGASKKKLKVKANAWRWTKIWEPRRKPHVALDVGAGACACASLAARWPPRRVAGSQAQQRRASQGRRSLPDPSGDLCLQDAVFFSWRRHLLRSLGRRRCPPFGRVARDGWLRAGSYSSATLRHAAVARCGRVSQACELHYGATSTQTMPSDCNHSGRHFA